MWNFNACSHCSWWIKGGNSPGGAYLEADLGQFLLSVGELDSFFFFFLSCFDFWVMLEHPGPAGDAAHPWGSARCFPSTSRKETTFVENQAIVPKHSWHTKLGWFSLGLNSQPPLLVWCWGHWSLLPIAMAAPELAELAQTWCSQLSPCAYVHTSVFLSSFYCWIQNRNFTE